MGSLFRARALRRAVYLLGCCLVLTACPKRNSGPECKKDDHPSGSGSLTIPVSPVPGQTVSVDLAKQFPNRTGPLRVLSATVGSPYVQAVVSGSKVLLTTLIAPKPDESKLTSLDVKVADECGEASAGFSVAMGDMATRVLNALRETGRMLGRSTYSPSADGLEIGNRPVAHRITPGEEVEVTGGWSPAGTSSETSGEFRYEPVEPAD